MYTSVGPVVLTDIYFIEPGFETRTNGQGTNYPSNDHYLKCQNNNNEYTMKPLT